MVSLLKIIGVFSLIVGVQFVYVESTFATISPHESMQLENYEPPNQGGPDSTQGAGTR